MSRHVRIRAFKAVTGKCRTCAFLSKVRKELRDPNKREYITALFDFHRSTYMGERQAYAVRYVFIVSSSHKASNTIVITVF